MADTLALQGGAAVASLARFAFRAERSLGGPAAEAALDRSLEALRTLNSSYASLLKVMRQLRAEHTDTEGISFRVGDVFVHRKFGYRGVVYGWDRRCQRDGEWAQQMNANPEQPFYYVLPDEGDCERLFGGLRLTKYVGQDNMAMLRDVHVVHRALDSYFDGYSEEQGRYIPSAKLQFEYPGDYAFKGELQPASDDANLLMQEDAQPGSEAAAAGAEAAAAGDADGKGDRSNAASVCSTPP